MNLAYANTSQKQIYASRPNSYLLLILESCTVYFIMSYNQPVLQQIFVVLYGLTEEKLLPIFSELRKWLMKNLELHVQIHQKYNEANVPETLGT